MLNILFIAEYADGELKRYSRELAGRAHKLADGGEVIALVVDGGMTDLETLGCYGVPRVISIQGGDCRGGFLGRALVEVIEDVKPDLVFATASDFGRDLLSRVAMRMGIGLMQDCMSVEFSGEGLHALRPIYGGNVLVRQIVSGKPAMATLRPNIFPLPKASAERAEVEEFSVSASELRTRVIETVDEESEMIDPAGADCVIAGGRAMRSVEGFDVIRELADLLGAAVGASRAAVDEEYISHDHQVGQSGRTVNPSIYIACGISGAIQHVAGMKTAKIIVAINRDPDALIFSKSDYGIVGDLFEVLPAITSLIRGE